MVPVSVINEKKIAADVRAAAKQLAPDVVRIRYEIGADWTGNPLISFRVVLSERASREDRLYSIAKKAERELVARIKPAELGLLADFRFRSLSEQADLQEESWA